MPTIVQEDTETSIPSDAARENSSGVTSISTVNEESLTHLVGLAKRPYLVEGDQVKAANSSRKRKKYSQFHGVTYSKRQSRYLAGFSKAGKHYHAGTYELETDAAYMYDLVVKEMLTKKRKKEKLNKRSLNFKSEEDYKRMRTKEVNERGLSDLETSVDFLSQLKTKAQGYVEKLYMRRADESTDKKKKPNQIIGNSARKRNKYSQFHGVSCFKNDDIYFAQVCRAKMTCYAGRYKLESDAAYMHDLVVNVLFPNTKQGEKCEKLNFKSEEDYKRMRAKEVNERGLSDLETSVDFLSQLKTKAQDYVLKFHMRLADDSTNEDKVSQQLHGMPLCDSAGKKMPTILQEHAEKSNSEVNQFVDADVITTAATNENNSNVASNEESLAQLVGLTKRSDLIIEGDQGKASDSADKKKKSSQFHGVSYLKKNGMYMVYMAQVGRARKACYAGKYKLETDAAYASDLLVSELFTKQGKKREKFNFKSVEDYENARKNEIKDKGWCEFEASVDLSILKAKVQVFVDKFLSKAPKTPRFRGTYKNLKQTAYKSQIYYQNNKYHLGMYQLESDGAKAYDKALKLLEGPVWKLNFKSEREYHEARSRELHERRIDKDTVESLTVVDQQIMSRLMQIRFKQKEAGKVATDRLIPAVVPKSVTHYDNDINSDESVPFLLNNSTARGESLSNQKQGDADFARIHQGHSESNAEDEAVIPFLCTDTLMKNVEVGAGSNKSDHRAGSISDESVDSESETNNASHVYDTSDSKSNVDMQIDDSNFHSPTSEKRDQSVHNDGDKVSHREESDASSENQYWNTRESSLHSPYASSENQYQDGPESSLSYLYSPIHKNQDATSVQTRGSDTSNRDMEVKKLEATTSPNNMQLTASIHPNPIITPINRANLDRDQLMILTEDQVNPLKFPIGCKIWSNFSASNDGEVCRKGKITGASLDLSLREILYEVLCEDGSSSLLNDAELAYAPGCPVQYSPSSFSDNNDSLPGEVLLCLTTKSSVCYFIDISVKGSGDVKVVKDVKPCQIKWRHINSLRA